MTLLVGYLWVYGSLIRKGAVKYVISTVLLLHHSKGTLSVNRNKVFNYFLLQLSSWDHLQYIAPAVVGLFCCNLKSETR